MSYHTVIINQPFGIGDLLWGNSIAHDFVDEGKRVIWACDPWIAPMSKHFDKFVLLNRNYLSIDINDRSDISQDGIRVIPLRFSDSICKVPYTDCMKSKYLYLAKDWTRWKNNFRCIRYPNAEKRLYYDICGLKDGEEYNFVCDMFATQGKKTVSIETNNGLKDVRLSIIPGFTIIDWLMVMQRAKNIFAVSSSNIYLFELFEMSAEKIHLYVRRPVEDNHKNYEYILSKGKYILMP